MTTSVGIRELKRDAAKLVRQVARGHSVVVTRYGRPAARLVPAAQSGVAAEDPGNGPWERERAAFERLEPRLRRTHRGRWVAIHGGRLAGAAGDSEVLARAMLRKLGRKPFFIGRVGAPPALIELPGFEVA